MKPDHRAFLEAIATSDDPAVRPGDRIRAIELLHGADDPDADLFEASTSLRDEDLDREIDAMTPVMIQLIRRDPEEAARYPLTTAAMGPTALTARHFELLAEELSERRSGDESATDKGALDGPASKDATPEPRGEDDAARTPEDAPGPATRMVGRQARRTARLLRLRAIGLGREAET